MYDSSLNDVRGYISDEKAAHLLVLTDVDLHRDKLVELLAHRKNIPAYVNFRDKMKVPKSKFEHLDTPEKIDYYVNSEIIESTVGSYIFNLFMNDRFDNYFYRVNGYINDTLDQGKQNDINDAMTNALLEDVITSDEYIDYLNRRDWLGYSTCHYLTPSLDVEAIAPHPEITKMREALYKQYAKELETDLVPTITKIDKILIEAAKEKIKDVPGLYIFLSGSKGSFENNYKATAIHRGAIKDEANNKFILSKSNLIEGIPRNEINVYANMMVTGAAAKALATQKGGYLNKMISSAFQNVIIDDGDCGTSGYLEVELTKDLIKEKGYIYKYIIDGDKLVLLTPKLIKEYEGKTVKMRSPYYCKGVNFCSTCAGALFGKKQLNVSTPGVLFSRYAGIMLNAYMKKFHDQSIKTKKVNIDDYIEKVNI